MGEPRPSFPRQACLHEWLASVSPRRDRAIDLGCGTGQATVALADHFGEVVGLDPSAEQIAHAEPHEAKERAGLADRERLERGERWTMRPRFGTLGQGIRRHVDERRRRSSAWAVGVFRLNGVAVARKAHSEKVDSRLEPLGSSDVRFERDALRL